MEGDFHSVDERGPPLSPHSEIMRLRAIIEVKDACLLNFSKTLRASDDKHKQTEAYLKDKVSELEEREASHRVVQAEHKALIGKHEKLLWSVQEQEEKANERIAAAEDKVKAAVEQRQAAEQLAQDRGREAYEKIAKAEEIVEMGKSALRLEVESLKGALMSADSERRQLAEELEELKSSALGNEERLARADAEIEELRAIVSGGGAGGGAGGGTGGGRVGKAHTAEAEIVRLSCELERCHISLSEAKREADMLRAHKRARDVEVQGLEHRVSVMRDEYRQLERMSEGEMARSKAVWQTGESQARAEVMMLREQLSMARAGRSSDAQALYEREAMVAEIEELRGVVSGLEGRLALVDAQRVRDRESVVRGEQRVLSLEEKLRQLGEAEREAVERAGYLEREVEQVREKEAVRGRQVQVQGASDRAVQDLEERLIAAKHQHQDQAMSLLGEIKDLRSRLNAKDSEAREFHERSINKEEQLRRLTSLKSQADAHIGELTSEISCLRRDLQAAMARPQGGQGGSATDRDKDGVHGHESVEEVRSLLADKCIEVANARDEARNLRMQLRESNAVLDEGKQHIVGLLKDVHKRDVLIRSLKDELQQLQINKHLKSATSQQQHHQQREEGKGTERGFEQEGVKPLFPHRDANSSNNQPVQAVLADRTNQVSNTRFSAPPNPATPPSLGLTAVSLPQPKQHPLHMSGGKPSSSAATSSGSLHIGPGDKLVAIGGVQVDGAPMDEVRAAAKAAAGLGDVDITLRRTSGDLYTIRARPRQAEALAGIPSP